MSMRGQLISKEYQRMVFVDDADGKRYVCYGEDLKSPSGKKGLSAKEKEKCMDLSLVLGDNW